MRDEGEGGASGEGSEAVRAVRLWLYRQEMIEQTAPPDAPPLTLADVVISTALAPECVVYGQRVHMHLFHESKDSSRDAVWPPMRVQHLFHQELQACPYCREPVAMWIDMRAVRVV